MTEQGADLLRFVIDCVDRDARDAEGFYTALANLHEGAQAATFSAAVALCGDSAPARRALGAELLGQLGPAGARSMAQKSADILCALLRDPADEVAEMAAFALGRLGERKAAAALASLAGHCSAEVRHGVAFALACLQAPETANALLALMRDASAFVRDWATTGMADLVAADGPEVRAALVARTDDAADATRAEALRGLALRRDARAIPGLRAALEEGREPEWTHIEAANVFVGPGEDAADLARQLREFG